MRRRPDREWDVFALEINLRKGGTTHPFATARQLTSGVYDPSSGLFRDAAGKPAYYAATDNLVDPSWVGRQPGDVRSMLDRAGLRWDPDTGTGVVPHLLDCLAIDGRMGYTAIARSLETVADLEWRAVAVLGAAAQVQQRAVWAGTGSPGASASTV